MKSIKKVVINPPFRWAGSKKKVLNEILNLFVKDKENYIEMFLGSGVVLLNVIDNNNILNYKNFIVNDINRNVIDFYLYLRDRCDKFINEISRLIEKYDTLTLSEKETFYYEIRNLFNEMEPSDKKTEIFYFLMKTGFNGVYRENKDGAFNVPFGRKEKININFDYINKISKCIQNVSFYNMDYADFINEMKKQNKLDDAFIYCDPPYLPDDDSMIQKQMLYTYKPFKHDEFFNNMKDISKKAKIMISMSESQKSDLIYCNLPFNKVDIKLTLRTINPKKIFKSNEVAFINYDIENVLNNDN